MDSIEQSRHEAGDLILPFEQTPEKWAQVHELAQLVAGQVPGRTSDAQTTLFKSNGIAAWDLAAATVVYNAARERHFGTDLPFFAS